MSVHRLRRLHDEDDPTMTTAPTADAPLRIAIATSDRRYLDAHFGSAHTIAVFDVGPESWRFVELLRFDDVTSEVGGHSDADDRIGPKIAALEGVAILFVLAIGGPSAARVVKAGIHPVKVKEPEAIPSVILRVQQMLKGNPPPWLRKVLGRTGDPAVFMAEPVA
ncbi:MAG: nitrogen fixation protein NifX [Geminicoccaceae bacterium]|nr:MAG: nitrogen fixation protein NifX [Geminicoccaceae bacterium]